MLKLKELFMVIGKMGQYTPFSRLSWAAVVMLVFSATLLVPQAQAVGYNPSIFFTALHFDGTNDVVDVGDLAILDGVSQYTIETWVKFDSFSNNSTIFAKRISGANRAVVFQCADNLGNVRIAVDNSYAETTGPLSLNTWHHIAIVYDGTLIGDANRFKLYVNGTLQSLIFAGVAVPSTTTGGSSSRLVLGAEYNGTVPVSGLSTLVVPFRGTIDDFRVWTVARTASEISTNKDVQLSGAESNLAVYYNFNQGIANGINTGITTLKDSAGSAETGNLWNFALSGTTSNWVGLTATAAVGGVAQIIAMPTASPDLSYLVGLASLVMLVGAGWLVSKQ